jgi:hypothetical protein
VHRHNDLAVPRVDILLIVARVDTKECDIASTSMVIVKMLVLRTVNHLGGHLKVNMEGTKWSCAEVQELCFEVVIVPFLIGLNRFIGEFDFCREIIRGFCSPLEFGERGSLCAGLPIPQKSDRIPSLIIVDQLCAILTKPNSVLR